VLNVNIGTTVKGAVDDLDKVRVDGCIRNRGGSSEQEVEEDDR
jgi:hypothetical protein